jgi:hypothetical protein
MTDWGVQTTRGLVRLSVAVRADQRTAVERLAAAEDLTMAQATRRLLDLGLAHWAPGSRAEELEEVTP